MSGQIILDPKYYPADFNVLSVNLPVSNSGGAALQSFALLYADRDILIDSVRMVLPVAVGANAAFTLWEVTNSAVPTGTGTATQIQVSDATASFATGGTYPAVAAFVLRTSGASANNILRTGSTLWLRASAGFTGGMTIVPQIQVRYRSQF